MAPGAKGPKNGASTVSPETAADWKPLRPNILISGTPGVGKTTLAKQLADQLGLRHIEVGEFARERNLLADHDALHDAFYMHEDAVLDELEPIMSNGGVILDHHSCDWYPERWIQLAVVLRVETEVLYDRLEARGYSKQKLDENIQAEIMQVVYEEAVSSYPKLQVLELQNNDITERDRNTRHIKEKWNALTQASYATAGDEAAEAELRAGQTAVRLVPR